MAEFTAKGANILVVDDDDDIREIVHILLAREGFTVREAANAEQALRRLDPLPDLVILDVMMPGLSGIELCREIRTKAMMPILFLSAKTRDVDKAEGLANGGDDYLIKPFSALELTSRVKALLRRSMVYQPQTAAAPPQTVQSGELSIDLTTGAAALAGNPLTLTKPKPSFCGCWHSIAAMYSRRGKFTRQSGKRAFCPRPTIRSWYTSKICAKSWKPI